MINLPNSNLNSDKFKVLHSPTKNDSISVEFYPFAAKLQCFAFRSNNGIASSSPVQLNVVWICKGKTFGNHRCE